MTRNSCLEGETASESHDSKASEALLSKHLLDTVRLTRHLLGPGVLGIRMTSEADDLILRHRMSQGRLEVLDASKTRPVSRRRFSSGKAMSRSMSIDCHAFSHGFCKVFDGFKGQNEGVGGRFTLKAPPARPMSPSSKSTRWSSFMESMKRCQRLSFTALKVSMMISPRASLATPSLYDFRSCFL